MRKCWICGSPATTAEHKMKRADLVRVYGRGKVFRSANLNYKRSDDQVVILQGPNSQDVKWPEVLCSSCNNSTTQPFDRAYDKFVEYCEANVEAVLASRQINFALVYGASWREDQLSLFRYFVKSLGCRLAAADLAIPDDLVTSICRPTFSTALWVCIAVNEDELSRPRCESNTLKLGNLVTTTGSQEPARYASSYFYRWLFFSFWYGFGPFGPVGGRWCADSQFVHLGAYSASEGAINIGSMEDPRSWPGH